MSEAVSSTVSQSWPLNQLNDFFLQKHLTCYYMIRPLPFNGQPAFTCSKLTVETIECQWCRSGVFFVNFECSSICIVKFEHIVAFQSINSL